MIEPGSSAFEFGLRTSDGLTLCGRGWLPDAPPRATVALVHGFGEHSGRYEHVARFLNDRGYAVLTFDQRGHGRSPGGRGETPSYRQLLDDIGALLEESKRRQPELPLFLYGHSMGGGEVLAFALQRRPELSGVISSSPWIELAHQPSPFQVALAGLLTRLTPRLSLPRGPLESGRLSHNPNVIVTYDADDLVHHRVTARLFHGCHHAGQQSLRTASSLSLPVLLLHGSADRITSCDASRRFAQLAGSQCTLRIWDGLLHELHNEEQWQEVMDEISLWLEERLPPEESRTGLSSG